MGKVRVSNNNNVIDGLNITDLNHFHYNIFWLGKINYILNIFRKKREHSRLVDGDKVDEVRFCFTL